MSPSIINDGRARRIGILGHYGGTNLGDETVVAILIRTLRDYYPNAELCGFSLHPASTEWRHAIKAFPIRRKSEVSLYHRPPPLVAGQVKPRFRAELKQRLKKWSLLFRALKFFKTRFYDVPPTILKELVFWRKCFQRLHGFDLLVVPGSGPLTDWWGGPWNHPYALLRWTLLAKLRGAKVIALSIGSERLNTRLGKWFCKWALSMMDYRSFRDRYSRDTMTALGLKGDNPVLPDQAFALLDVIDVTSKDSALGASQQPFSGLTVGVCPVGKDCCVQPDVDDRSYESYSKSITTFLVWLVRNGYRVAFCHTDEDYDQPVVEQIINAIKTECRGVDVDSRIIQEPIVTTDDLLRRLLRCDIMIASRYHAVVLPFVLQKPVLAISYQRKIGDLMSALGQGAYELPMDKAEVGEMMKLFRALEQNRDAIVKHLGEVVSEYRCSLARQYEYVFGRLGGEARRPEGIARAERRIAAPGVAT